MTTLDQTINEEPDKTFRLVVHIGMGKTGTSSIQKALFLEQANLIEQGKRYLGVMLEHAPIKRYPWQRGGGMAELMSQSDSEITAQLTDIFTCSAESIINSGGDTAIVSNESMFDLPSFTHVFELLATKGWEVEIIVYIRRHDAWMRSAYIQWGLNHKTYEGPLLPFSKWTDRCYSFFSGNLNRWANIKGCKLIVRNFDKIGDVVEDFFAITNIPRQKTSGIRDNESPSPEELLLRSLFNNQVQGIAFPAEFDRLMGTGNLNFNHSASTFLSDHLPSEDDLLKVVENCTEDRRKIDQILSDNGQQPIDTSPLKLKPVEVDSAKLSAILFEMLVNQARKLEILESRINKIETSDN